MWRNAAQTGDANGAVANLTLRNKMLVSLGHIPPKLDIEVLCCSVRSMELTMFRTSGYKRQVLSTACLNS